MLKIRHARRPAFGPLAALSAATLLWAPLALAQEQQEEEELEDRHILFDIENPPELSYRLTEQLSFGAALDSEFNYEGDFDLDASEDQDLARLNPELAVSFGLDVSENIFAYLEVHLERDFDFRAPGDEPDPETKLIVDEAYLTFSDIVESLSLQVGRARLRDRREWLMDQELDGLRTFLRLSPFGLELAANREQFFDYDLLHKDSITAIDNYLAKLRYRPDETFEANGYVLIRDNRDADADDLTFLGVQAIADWPGGGGWWLDSAFVFGREDESQVSGFALDAGVTVVSDAPLGLSGTLAAAFGSGDSDPEDGHDHAFRQSGLQENQDGFNGITRFKYYGEVLDPELSNLVVLTAGLGLRPSEGSSLDLVYHRYWQPQAADFLREAALDADPGGRHHHLGDEIDLVLGLSEIEAVDIEAAVGVFLPGKAYSAENDAAFLARVEVSFDF
ncbi:alginate export family protein [Pelagibius marinus]|uniref:alginate export family protein n=1 Tax=Pelagibius marinus TaxID=2762760 RepID=UPI001872E6BE|nr:alginate export family protein [Pelagibius marinus]